MITKFFHSIVAQPLVYDCVQTVVGGKAVRRRLAKQVAALPPAKTVIDLGGGTGLNASLWPAGIEYICLDMDPVKLAGLKQKNPSAIAVLGDATQTPFADASADAVICTAVSHHIPDAHVPGLFREAFRILRPTGHFIFFDAVWKPRRLPSRILWHYDRGSFPRPADRIRALIEAEGRIQHWQQFRIFHEYILCVATRR